MTPKPLHVRDIPLAVGDVILLQVSTWLYARQLKVEFLSSHWHLENKSWYLSPYPLHTPRGRKRRVDLYEVPLQDRVVHYEHILNTEDLSDATKNSPHPKLASASYNHPRRFSNRRTNGCPREANQPLAPTLPNPSRGE